jgi:hypothetical protein
VGYKENYLKVQKTTTETVGQGGPNIFFPRAKKNFPVGLKRQETHFWQY